VNTAIVKAKMVASLLVVGVMSLLFAQIGLGHHSGEMFEPEKTVVLSGTVKEFRYINPHSWLIVGIESD